MGWCLAQQGKALVTRSQRIPQSLEWKGKMGQILKHSPTQTTKVRRSKATVYYQSKGQIQVSTYYSSWGGLKSIIQRSSESGILQEFRAETNRYTALICSPNWGLFIIGLLEPHLVLRCRGLDMRENSALRFGPWIFLPRRLSTPEEAPSLEESFLSSQVLYLGASSHKHAFILLNFCRLGSIPISSSHSAFELLSSQEL